MGYVPHHYDLPFFSIIIFTTSPFLVSPGSGQPGDLPWLEQEQGQSARVTRHLDIELIYLPWVTWLYPCLWTGWVLRTCRKLPQMAHWAQNAHHISKFDHSSFYTKETHGQSKTQLKTSTHVQQADKTRKDKEAQAVRETDVVRGVRLTQIPSRVTKTGHEVKKAELRRASPHCCFPEASLLEKWGCCRAYRLDAQFKLGLCWACSMALSQGSAEVCRALSPPTTLASVPSPMKCISAQVLRHAKLIFACHKNL